MRLKCNDKARYYATLVFDHPARFRLQTLKAYSPDFIPIILNVTISFYKETNFFRGPARVYVGHRSKE